MKKQPAKVNYFFHDGYVDFKNTVVQTFSECKDGIEDRWEDTKDNFSELVDCVSGLEIGGIIKYAALFGLAVGRLIFIILVTPILSLLLSLLQGIVMMVVMMTVYILFCLLAFADWVYRSIKKVSTSCPSCQNKFDLPSYRCECGAIHTRLIPSKYGILFRTCECGRELRTTFFNGRHKQNGTWICPECGYELSGSLQRDIPIPVVGGPSSGKTCFISMALAEIERNAASKYGLEFIYKPNEQLDDDYEVNKQSMSGGRLPKKTQDTTMKYYQFYLTPKKEYVKNLVSVCDVAGETYESEDEIGKQIGYKYANAFIMIVDPLSVQGYREEVKESVDISKYSASTRNMDEILSTLIKNLENMKCLNAQNIIKTNVAVVFSKCDIPGLEEKIGETAVTAYMQQNEVKSKYEARNKVCEKFLTDYDEVNFLNSLRSKFKSVQFFTCSALGHVADGSAFQPDGVEEPVLWLVNTIQNIKVKNKLGQ